MSDPRAMEREAVERIAELIEAFRRSFSHELPYNIHFSVQGRDGHWYPEWELPF